jgi:hypothetical protein
MAPGDVLALRRGIGFGAKEKLERFVVVQNDVLSDALETVLAVPLDDDSPTVRSTVTIVSNRARLASSSGPHSIA